jgi:hypothetical protein
MIPTTYVPAASPLKIPVLLFASFTQAVLYSTA